jgi:nucleotide-binding universal stress UspA family protein
MLRLIAVVLTKEVAPTMTMRTILVPVESHPLMRATLETTLNFARRFNSHIEGVPLRAVAADLYFTGAFGGLPVVREPEEGAASANEQRQLFESFMQSNGVPRGDLRSPELSFGWRHGEWIDDGFVGSYARVFDLTVFARPSETGGARLSTLEAALFEGGRPILIAPPVPKAVIGENIVIAWNRSTETARVVALGMGLLERAKRVVVLTIEGGTVSGPTGEELTARLKANGIAAEEVTVAANKQSTGEAILAQATALGCDLLFKGAYTQSRLRQMIFGGATSHILAATELPVLMAH